MNIVDIARRPRLLFLRPIFDIGESQKRKYVHSHGFYFYQILFRDEQPSKHKTFV